MGLKVFDKAVSDNALRAVRKCDVALANSLVKKRVVHFKDGSSFEYPVATKEQLDFYRSVFRGSDKRIDEFGEDVVSSGAGNFVAPVMDIAPNFFRDLDCDGHVFNVVGHGRQFNSECDAYVYSKACLNVAKHKEHPEHVFTHKVHHHCYRWECPKDFFYGCAVRESKRIAQRLVKKSKELELPIEAGMISVPKTFYGLSESDMRAKCIDALFARRWLGGCLAFHPLRYRSSMWVGNKFILAKFYFAPHYHFLGFFKDDIDKCRQCEHYNAWGSDSAFRTETKYSNHGSAVCLNCLGFEGLTRRLYREDSFICKIFSKRGDGNSIFNTALYELSHAGFEANTKKVHIVTWVGNCSPRRFKSVYQSEKMVCPETACKSELVRGFYSGKHEIVKSRSSPDYQMDSWLPLVEDNVVVWHEGR